jgi:hypothetical protein
VSDVPRHSPDYYRERLGDETPAVGDRMWIPSVGGTIQSRMERFPPPLEIHQDGGVYVLIDEGPPGDWRYEFVGG